jgi:nicotinate-nucleotide adenylyltransferase
VRVGILGGTFDPPHVGHLIAAADAVEVLQLDRVVLVPAHAQPLKQHSVWATSAQRLAMTRLAAGEDERLAVSSIEIDRGGLSFMVDTLSEWVRRSPGDELFLLLGADVVRSFARWREPLEVMRLAEVVVWQRGEALPGAVADLLPRDASGRIPAHRVVEARRIDVSSTEVRARVRAGQSIHGFVPDAVGAYIREVGLYLGGHDREEGDDQGTDR